MKRSVERFLRDEQGAVTVDWVVLTGAVLLMVMLVMTVVDQGAYVAAAQGISAGVTQAAQFGATP